MIAQSDGAKKAQEAIGRCEKAIKALILIYALSLMSQDSLLRQIRSLVLAMAKDFPKGLDAKPYEDGMWKSALGWKRVLGDSMREKVAVAKSIDPSLPKDPAKLIAEAKKAKLAPTTIETEDLGTALNKRILKVAQDEPLAIPSQSTKPLDAWGAAESEVRGKEQERMVGEWVAAKGDLGIISVHLNCSERCFPDQGKIVSKTLPAIDSSLWTGRKVDGRKVYSWNAMHARTDKYGYHNFIIDGFNCRHSIKPYEPGDIRKKPTKAEAAEVSGSEQAMRSMERALRRQWQAYDMMRKADPAKAAKIKSAWDEGIRNYESFSIRSGLEPQEWRCKTA